MLTRIVVCAGLVTFVTTQAPAMLGPTDGGRDSAPFAGRAISPINANQAQLTAGRDGHFSGSFLLNGRPVSGIIDTGATFVALNQMWAAQIGIPTDDLTYDHTVETAAGSLAAARVRLGSIAIGGVSVKDVDALVLRETGFPDVLIGMSFLTRLSSYTVVGGAMSLVE